MFALRCLLVCLCILLWHNTALCKELVSLKVWPEDVGVFVSNKTQQFQATAVFNDGSEEDYTEKVGWSLAKYPLPEQTLKPEEIATINRTGLLTVRSTWGRVKVVATYPPPTSSIANLLSSLLLSAPGEEKPKPKPKFLPGILKLLLLNHSNGLVNTLNIDDLPIQNENSSAESGKFILQKRNFLFGSSFTNPATIFQINAFMNIPLCHISREQNGFGKNIAKIL